MNNTNFCLSEHENHSFSIIHYHFHGFVLYLKSDEEFYGPAETIKASQLVVYLLCSVLED